MLIAIDLPEDGSVNVAGALSAADKDPAFARDRVIGVGEEGEGEAELAVEVGDLAHGVGADAEQLVAGADQPVEPAGPGIHVLAEQHDLQRAAGDQSLGFGDDVRERPRDFGAAGVGNDAIGAEFVAAFLNGEEGRGADFPPRRQRAELGGGGHVGVERGDAGGGLRDQPGEVMIRLRADDHAVGLSTPERDTNGVASSDHEPVGDPVGQPGQQWPCALVGTVVQRIGTPAIKRVGGWYEVRTAAGAS